MKTLLPIILLAALLTGCAGKHFDIETGSMLTNAVAPVLKPAVAIQPPLPPGFTNMQEMERDMTTIETDLVYRGTYPPQPVTLAIAWDIYTNPAATSLAVQGAANLCGAWTNEAVYSPPNLTNQFTGTYFESQHFLRVMVQ